MVRKYTRKRPPSEAPKAPPVRRARGRPKLDRFEDYRRADFVLLSKDFAMYRPELKEAVCKQIASSDGIELKCAKHRLLLAERRILRTPNKITNTRDDLLLRLLCSAASITGHDTKLCILTLAKCLEAQGLEQDLAAYRARAAAHRVLDHSWP
jgi:hypothetical protein